MFLDKVRNLTDKVEQEFDQLNENQLNWKPTPEIWSIGQCLDHIIKSNEQYLLKLNIVLSPQYKPAFWEKINPFTNYTGKKMIYSLGEIVSKKYKNPLIFAPSKNNISMEIISAFQKHNEKVEKLFNLLETQNKTESIITSPVASLITLRVSDVMKLIIVHEQRHIIQAINIKTNHLFPL